MMWIVGSQGVALRLDAGLGDYFVPRKPQTLTVHSKLYSVASTTAFSGRLPVQSCLASGERVPADLT